MGQAATLILIMAVAVLAPLLAHAVRHRAGLRVPVVIFEIVLGIVIGPDALGLAKTGDVIDALSHLGLSMLIFLAGYEIRFDAIRGDTLRRSVSAWLISLALGLGVALALTGADLARTVIVGTALTSTALGTVLPILRDSGDLEGRFGMVATAFGAAGEFGPIIAMAVLLSGRDPGVSTVVLMVFAAITAGAVFWALRPRPPWFSHLIRTTLHTSAQFAVRFVMLLLVAMLALSEVFDLDVLLGAFAAGMLTRLVLQGAAPESSDEVLAKVEAMGFGFLVPLFYIVTGIQFDLKALLEGGRSLFLLPVFLVLFLAVRGLPAYALAPRDLTGPSRRALTVYSSTCLPLVVAITTIGLDEGTVRQGEAAALVGAAMISVLVFPLVGMRLRASVSATAATAAGAGPEQGEEEEQDTETW
ncbi:cation:proton antiporter [Streptomyces beihaiensis]|uniref:Cation:proton antiporter n=1 Tax=Streptomyces beihaiensis TaxID=2984495 RepID=A0ABT3TP72_9ACTN|nr:cation:proton antiporter [Streptomyces beihaiensis]MCX3058835.1 cation:proton antiporter [Streptomyces beihaiensis]